MKRMKIIHPLLSILLICAMAVNFAACSSESIKSDRQETTDSTIHYDQHPNDNPQNDREIQAFNLMQGIESGSVNEIALDDAFIGAGTEFAIALFQGSVENGEEENLLISPLSVMLALAMTANGADGETKAEMEALLGGSLTIEQLNEYLYSYVNALPSDEKYKVEIANSIWFKDNESAITVSPEFLQTNADYYGAAAYKAPFDDQTVKDINNWVDQNTDGMIEEIINALDPNTVMCLINALVFDAEWSKPYSESSVREGIFTSQDGEKRTVEMMHSSESIYLSDEFATGFIKHYEKAKYSFVALLPNEGVDIYDYIASLTADSLRETLGSAQYGSMVNAAMPKFTYDYSLEMKELLSELGIPTAFDKNAADFSRLGQSLIYERFYIAQVFHKTHITVNELGTKAGAATAVIMNGVGGMPDIIYNVTLDRPFVYLIIDNENNLPLFIGALTDIQQ